LLFSKARRCFAYIINNQSPVLWSLLTTTFGIEEGGKKMKRFSLTLLGLFVILSVVLTACGTTPTATPAQQPVATEEAAQPTSPAAQPSGGKQQVEVFSWWTGGGEAAGLEAMIKVFKTQYPDIEFINAAVAGGAGTNARAVLASRLQAGDPPDSWQGHAGQELIGTYVAGNQILPLNDLYESEGWIKVMPETLIPLISQDGKIYSVPVNIHRANVLWYNPKILKDHNINV